jgi:hypothetical protein
MFSLCVISGALVRVDRGCCPDDEAVAMRPRPRPRSVIRPRKSECLMDGQLRAFAHEKKSREKT